MKIESSGLMVVSQAADGLTHGPAARIRRGEVKVPTLRIQELRDLTNSERLLDLKRKYSSGAHDGTQWVLLIEQPPLRKAVYLDNEFPEEVQRLSRLVDEIVETSSIQWHESSPTEHEALERVLWNAVRE